MWRCEALQTSTTVLQKDSFDPCGDCDSLRLYASVALSHVQSLNVWCKPAVHFYVGKQKNAIQSCSCENQDVKIIWKTPTKSWNEVLRGSICHIQHCRDIDPLVNHIDGFMLGYTSKQAFNTGFPSRTAKSSACSLKTKVYLPPPTLYSKVLFNMYLRQRRYSWYLSHSLGMRLVLNWL